MFNIIAAKRKFVAIGCSHGAHADPHALQKVLRFCESYKPDIRIHLGDFTDQAAFRSGAAGTNDEHASIADDLTHGLNFLNEFRPTLVLNGNHEDRLWKLAEHHNEIVARAASSVIGEIRACAESHGAKYIEKYDISMDHPKIGDYTLMHGYMYPENAIRDHAETWGNVIHAHTHRAGMASGRRSDRPTGYCVGTLSHLPAMSYAKTRRATLSWNHGIVWGEATEDKCYPNLSQCQMNQAQDWALPL
jgi:predicted phosphodiesterase